MLGNGKNIHSNGLEGQTAINLHLPMVSILVDK